MDVLTPPNGTGPGVLVAHPWWGLNQTIRDYGAALAREGFVVGLADVFSGETTTSIDTAETLIRKYWSAAEGILTEGLRNLAGHDAVVGDRVGAIGFSFGGFHLLELLARPDLPLARLATYYATHPLSEHHAPVLAHLAASDDYESAEDMAAIAAALAKDTESAAHSYPGTKHWFAEADRPEFDAAAAARAFQRTVAFLRG